MNTKFNIGDKVSYISGVGNAETVFEVGQIVIGKNYVNYRDSKNNYAYDEKYLTLYIEPKKKVIKYLWAYQYNNSQLRVSTYFLTDEQDFKSEYSDAVFFKRLDWSATEFEAE